MFEFDEFFDLKAKVGPVEVSGVRSDILSELSPPEAKSHAVTLLRVQAMIFHPDRRDESDRANAVNDALSLASERGAFHQLAAEYLAEKKAFDANMASSLDASVELEAIQTGIRNGISSFADAGLRDQPESIFFEGKRVFLVLPSEHSDLDKYLVFDPAADLQEEVLNSETVRNIAKVPADMREKIYLEKLNEVREDFRPDALIAAQKRLETENRKLFDRYFEIPSNEQMTPAQQKKAARIQENYTTKIAAIEKEELAKIVADKISEKYLEDFVVERYNQYLQNKSVELNKRMEEVYEEASQPQACQNSLAVARAALYQERLAAFEITDGAVKLPTRSKSTKQVAGILRVPHEQDPERQIHLDSDLKLTAQDLNKYMEFIHHELSPELLQDRPLVSTDDMDERCYLITLNSNQNGEPYFSFEGQILCVLPKGLKYNPKKLEISDISND